MKNLFKKSSPVAWFVLGVLVAGGTGTAYAANGGTLRLGQSNSATATTKLTNTTGTALKVLSKAGTPPINVGSNSTKVPYFNADKLDGKDSTSFVAGKMFVGQIQNNGVKFSGSPSSVSSARLSTGRYTFTIPRSAVGCFAQATVGATSVNVGYYNAVSISTSYDQLTPGTISVSTTDGAGFAYDAPFVISVFCP